MSKNNWSAILRVRRTLSAIRTRRAYAVAAARSGWECCEGLGRVPAFPRPVSLKIPLTIRPPASANSVKIIAETKNIVSWFTPKFGVKIHCLSTDPTPTNGAATGTRDRPHRQPRRARASEKPGLQDKDGNHRAIAQSAPNNRIQAVRWPSQSASCVHPYSSSLKA